MSRLLRGFREVLEKRELIVSLAAADFKKRFVGSFLGIVWMFIQPIITVLIYYVIFQVGFRSQPVADVPYVLWLIPAIVPWFFFNDAWGGATNCLYEYRHLVKKMVFPVGLLPIIKITASLFVHLIFIWILLAVYLLAGVDPSMWWMQCLYYSFCTAFLALGLSYLTASVNAFFKDVGQFVQIVLQIGMWVAPIMWDLNMFSESVHTIFKLNPVYYIVEGYRDCFIGHGGFWQRPALTLYFWCVAAAVFLIGTGLFRKLRPHFADVL